jgi:hypothetical protein
MKESPDEFRNRVLCSIEKTDASTRNARADRLVWLFDSTPKLPSAFAGRFEQLTLLEEVRFCFVDGRFIATLLASTAFVEQTLMEELEIRGDNGQRRTLAQAIESARKAGFLDDQVLDRADRLRKVRNPLGHFRAGDDPETIVNRYRTAKCHPTAMLEQDAKHAVSLVYELFVRTLREF